MGQILKLAFLVLVLSSCNQSDNTKQVSKLEYSEAFLKQFQNSKLTLRSDSILYPLEADSVIVLIPQYIPRNKEVAFSADKVHKLFLKQINYTELEFRIQTKNKHFKGKASLHPQFHIGAETYGFDDGEYLVTYYYVTESNHPCITHFGLGNKNIEKEESEEIYAMLAVSGDICREELHELTFKKLKKE